MGDVRCISVSVTDDTTVENDEIFYVDFSSRSGLTVNSVARSASITILDDDGEYNSCVKCIYTGACTDLPNCVAIAIREM